MGGNPPIVNYRSCPYGICIFLVDHRVSFTQPNKPESGLSFAKFEIITLKQLSLFLMIKTEEK
jgi:hypothetical protein